MKTSANGRALIEACEGCRLTAYQDSVGVWTVGFGHTSAAGLPSVRQGMSLSGKAEADEILARDLEKVERQVAQYVKVGLTQNQFDALVSFTFNLGPGNLSRSTLLRKLNAGDVPGASAEFGKWNRAGGKVLDGLTKRRRAERLMFDGKVADALALAGADRVIPDVEPVPFPPKQPLHPAAKPAASAGGFFIALAAMVKAGAPLWACLSVAFIVAVAVYLIIHNRSKQ
jgi:GH24 family phage-related lysozyme (muramidase)